MNLLSLRVSLIALLSTTSFYVALTFSLNMSLIGVAGSTNVISKDDNVIVIRKPELKYCVTITIPDASSLHLQFDNFTARCMDIKSGGMKDVILSLFDFIVEVHSIATGVTTERSISVDDILEIIFQMVHVGCNEDGQIKVLKLDATPKVDGLIFHISIPSLSDFCKYEELEYLSLSHVRVMDYSSKKSTLIPECIPQNLNKLKRLRLHRSLHLYGIIPLHILNSRKYTLHRIIPRSFSLLNSSLQYLDLSMNHLPCRLDMSIFSRLSSLQYLNLSFNSLTTPMEGTYNEYQHSQMFASLSSLDLSHNSLSGPLPNFLFKLRNLKKLYLSSNMFIGPLVSIMEATNLQELVLDFNNLSGDVNNLLHSTSNLIGGEAHNPKLSKLSLSHNSLHGDVNELIMHLATLSQLHLSHNSFSNQAFPIALCKQQPKLLNLDISHNNFNGDLPFDGNLCIGLSKSINILSLSHNSFIGPYPSWLGSCTNLSFLDLSYNNLIGHIPESWRMLWNLKTMDLSGNKLLQSSSHTPILPRWLFQLPNLESLSLVSTMRDLANSDGLLFEPDSCSISIDYRGLCSPIRSLDISHNKLDSNTIKCFLSHMTPPIRSLQISGNPLSLSLNETLYSLLLPLMFKSPFISQIIELQLNDCDIHGDFDPFAILSPHLLHAKKLSLARNQLHGVIPQAIFSNLNYNHMKLNLSGNNLHGVIPEDVIPMNLYNVDLTGNTITHARDLRKTKDHQHEA